jgi:cell division septum initiation protein DivIVA
MNYAKKVDFNERQKSAIDARKALLEKFKPKPTVTAVEPIDRAARLAAEREAVRIARAAEREESLIQRAAAAEAQRLAEQRIQEDALMAKRAERKDRKALEKMDSQQRRAARLALYSKA